MAGVLAGAAGSVFWAWAFELGGGVSGRAATGPAGLSGPVLVYGGGIALEAAAVAALLRQKPKPHQREGHSK